MVILALTHKWKMGHIDIETAFVNADVDRNIYVTHQINLSSDMKSNSVYHLLKNLYGIYQASLQWFTKLKGKLEEMGYNSLKSEQSGFQRKILNN